MKKKKIFISVIVILIISKIFINNTGKIIEEYSTTPGNKRFFYYQDYTYAMDYLDNICWNDLVIDVRTVGVGNPVSLSFNFFINHLPSENEFTIKQIELRDNHNEVVDLYMQKDFPMTLSFNKFGKLYNCSFSSDNAYSFKVFKTNIQRISVEVMNNNSKEVHTFYLTLDRYVI